MAYIGALSINWRRCLFGASFSSSPKHFAVYMFVLFFQLTLGVEEPEVVEVQEETKSDG